MLTKLSVFIIFLLIINLKLTAREPDPYVEKLHEKKYLKLPDGKEVILVRLFNEIGPSMRMRLYLRHGSKIIWDVTYYTDFETFWADAHFLPLYNKTFNRDLNSDSYPEIAIGVWHGGNAMHTCKAFIFSVKENKLEFLMERERNYEFSRSFFDKKEDSKI